jgi:hypothetical protein
MEDHKKMLSTQILIKVEVVKFHFKVDMEARIVDIINMKVKLMEVDEETLEEKEVEEVVEVVLEIVMEVIEVNNQIATLIATIGGNLGTWQITIIKGSMCTK